MSAFLEVESPGIFTTVQDLGRYGFAHLGISAAGAADPMALRIGNLLVGNEEGEAGLEMTLQGGAFRFAGDAVVAFTGSHSPHWKPVRVAAGDRIAIPGELGGSTLLSLGSRRPGPATGAREPLDSRAEPRSADSQGRALQRGDRIGIAGRVRGEPRWAGLDWPLAPALACGSLRGRRRTGSETSSTI